MKRYQVFVNGLPADIEHFRGNNLKWANSKFDTILDANAYLNDWLHRSPGDFICLNPGEKYVVLAQTVEIREINESPNDTLYRLKNMVNGVTGKISNLVDGTTKPVDAYNKLVESEKALEYIYRILNEMTKYKYTSCSCDNCEQTGGTNDPNH